MILRVMVVFPATLIAVVSTMTAILTAPELIAARRVHQRFAAEVGASSPQPLVAKTTQLVSRVAGAGLFTSLRRVAENQSKQRTDRKIPESLDRVVRHLRSGATLPLALRRVGDEDPVLSRLAQELAAGRPLRDAVASWRSEDDQPNRKLTATALELASTAGGASAKVLDGVAASLRERVALEREVAALSSQSRASAVVLVVAPLVFAAVIAMFDHRIFDVLIGSPIGWVCVALGLGLDALGALWMAKMIGRHR